MIASSRADAINKTYIIPFTCDQVSAACCEQIRVVLPKTLASLCFE